MADRVLPPLVRDVKRTCSNPPVRASRSRRTEGLEEAALPPNRRAHTMVFTGHIPLIE